MVSFLVRLTNVEQRLARAEQSLRTVPEGVRTAEPILRAAPEGIRTVPESPMILPRTVPESPLVISRPLKSAPESPLFTSTARTALESPVVRPRAFPTTPESSPILSGRLAPSRTAPGGLKGIPGSPRTAIPGSPRAALPGSPRGPPPRASLAARAPGPPRASYGVRSGQVLGSPDSTGRNSLNLGAQVGIVMSGTSDITQRRVESYRPAVANQEASSPAVVHELVRLGRGTPQQTPSPVRTSLLKSQGAPDSPGRVEVATTSAVEKQELVHLSHWMERPLQQDSKAGSLKSEVVLGTPESQGRTASGSPEVEKELVHLYSMQRQENKFKAEINSIPDKATHVDASVIELDQIMDKVAEVAASKMEPVLQALASLSVRCENTQRDVASLSKRVQDLEVARKHDFLTDIVARSSDSANVTEPASGQGIAADLRIGKSLKSFQLMGGSPLPLEQISSTEKGTMKLARLAKSLSTDCIMKSPNASQRLSKTIFRSLRSEDGDAVSPPEVASSLLSARSDGPIQYRSIMRSGSSESLRQHGQRLSQHAFRMLREENGTANALESSMTSQLSARSDGSMHKESNMRTPSARSSSPRYRGP
mmetsp:Transcript_118805/g.216124  ORF Transcript_118805/g.216124 Transcript_118805/m.216124 type:complete len:595 (-) Transcript_118805:26-1810(-)